MIRNTKNKCTAGFDDPAGFDHHGIYFRYVFQYGITDNCLKITVGKRDIGTFATDDISICAGFRRFI